MPQASPASVGADARAALVAREPLLDELAALLLEHRSLLIEGPAGVGKTAVLQAVGARFGSIGVNVTASEALASIPLGVFLPLLDDQPNADDQSSADDRPNADDHSDTHDRPGPDDGPPVGLALLAQRVRLALRGRVLLLDDVPHLDAASAGLVHQLAGEGMTVVATARHGAPVHDAIAALARDHLWLRREIPPLELAQTGELVGQLLGGTPDTGLIAEIHRRTRGNPLFVRELVAQCRHEGAIEHRHGLWVAPRGVPRMRSLGGLLSLRLERLAADERRVAELTALADPLDWSVGRALAGDAAIEAAEAAGVIRFQAGHRPVLALAHPLYRDAVLEALPVSRRARLFGELADASGTADPVRLGHWRLEAGVPLPAQEWLALAAHARVGDPELAERFLRRAVAEGGGPTASLALVDLFTHRHRVEEAEAILDELDRHPLDAQLRAATGLLRAFLLSMPGHRPAEALAIIEALDPTGAVPMAGATRAGALWLLGRFAAATRVATRVFEDPASPLPAAAHAGLVLVSVALYGGDLRAFTELADRVEPFVLRARAAIPEGPQSLDNVRGCAAVMMSGEPAAAAERVEAAWLAALHDGDDASRAQFAYLVGWSEVHRGNLVRGTQLLREARAGSGTWVAMTMPWVLALLTRALVRSGEQAEAEAVLGELRHLRRSPLFDETVEIAHAEVMAGRGEIDAAAHHAVRTGDEAAARGAHTIAHDAWCAALRLGSEVAAGRLLRGVGAGGLAGAVGAAVRAHAQAVTDRDLAALERAASQLAAAGAMAHAVDAQAGAVARLHAAGDPLRAEAAAARLRRLLARCPGLRSPVAARLDQPMLTAREAEIALLAAGGRSDRDIADHLGIALRTVQTHLGRVYGKLGVRSRGELGASLISDSGRG